MNNRAAFAKSHNERVRIDHFMFMIVRHCGDDLVWDIVIALRISLARDTYSLNMLEVGFFVTVLPNKFC